MMSIRIAALTVLVMLALVLAPAQALGQDAAGETTNETAGQGRAVLITGASSGIGRLTAELLAEEGFYVYAGARKQEDLDELNALENIEAVRLDVTDQGQIDAAVEQVRAGGRGLYGLINNAGVAVIYPLIETDDEEMLFQFDVNVLGPVRVTRAFAPMLIESQGRLSTTGSIAGYITSMFSGPYAMSKHAVEAFADTLEAELAGFGVKVSLIDPGAFNSDIGKSLVRRMKGKGVTSEGSRYAAFFDQMLASDGDRSSLPAPQAVAEAFLHAMTDPDPKLRYMVTPNEAEARMTINKILDRMAQMNAGQPYEFDRDTLIEMLDAALERAAK